MGGEGISGRLSRMSMPDRLAAAVNDQVTLELASSLGYVQLSAYFEAEDLPGMANWMRAQAGEERNHADRFMAHLIDRGGRVQIGEIQRPPTEPATPLVAFQVALEQERQVSESIRRLYRLADEVGDLDALPLLQWFLTEQIEEEASVNEIISQLERVGQDGSALLILDRELGSRGSREGS
jgi:ferritin